MALSWLPRLNSDRSFGTSYADGEPIDFGFAATTADEVQVYFLLTVDSTVLTIPAMTEIHRVVMPNSGTVGPIRFSAWKKVGPTTGAEENFVTLTGAEFNPWTWTMAVYPGPDVSVILDEDLAGISPAAFSAAAGPVIGSILTVGSITAPAITYPGDNASAGTYFRDVDPGDGPWTQSHGYMRTIASDLPGEFIVTSGFSQRAVLLGVPPVAPQPNFHAG